MNLLEWQNGDGISITSPQLIAYKNERGNVTNLPQLQFVVSVQELDRQYYPVVGAYDSCGHLVWHTAYREFGNFDSAFKFAKNQVEDVFQGSYDDGSLRHDMLNAWASEILECLR